MGGWRLLERDTSKLRAEVDCPPDACVYRNEAGLTAIVYCQVGRNFTAWHLYVSGPLTMPAIEDLLDARAVLLPGIDQWQIEAPMPGMHNVIHMIEVPEGPVHVTRQ